MHKVALRRWVVLCLSVLALSMTGCSKPDPLAQLEEEARLLADNLDNKRTSKVMDQLHAQFHAQGSEYDRDWAKRTMTLLFLRHNNVHVLPLGVQNRVLSAERGETTAQVTLAGAAQLLPNAASSYAVRLEWWREGDRWQLARLTWE
ncbi:hypothetical protein SAMN05216214_10942 [Atopomonas hussainii]|uniref:DUF4440 domain-containing protein n=1 Tax=Atopomonas hussainii TaxID=1429083 RepID=A0A1H7N8C6_9GAMM|nr:hypothetical protein [Atopomonas hussainii]SEL19218.1 hypothetical protein SAMN05216214_10942 [Atopomonas hussainii]